MDNHEIFEVTKIMSNLKNHDFSVQNYRMVKDEADVVIKALEIYKQFLRADKISVPDVFEALPKLKKELAINAKRNAQLFDLKN